MPNQLLLFDDVSMSINLDLILGHGTDEHMLVYLNPNPNPVTNQYN